MQGNVGNFLHLAIISLWLFRNNFNTKIALYTAIAIGTMFKLPIFAFYLLLPLLAEARISVSRILPGLITMIAVILVYALQAVMFPELFSGFINNVNANMFFNTMDKATPLDTAILEDTKVVMNGWSIISLLTRVSNSYVVIILGYVITSLLIIAFWVYYKRRYLDKIENTNFTESCISIIPVIICMVIMPRLLIYEYAIINFLLIYLLLKIKVFEINYNFIFKSKISLLGITAISIWTIHWILYFVRFIQPDEILSLIISVWFPTFLVIIIALVDRSKKIRLDTWPQ